MSELLDHHVLGNQWDQCCVQQLSDKVFAHSKAD